MLLREKLTAAINAAFINSMYPKACNEIRMYVETNKINKDIFQIKSAAKFADASLHVNMHQLKPFKLYIYYRMSK